MYRIILPCILLACYISACSSRSGDATQEIEYAKLDSLQTEVILEIGESDAYLPGQLQGLKRTPSGGYLVADWASHTIEQFDANGDHRGTVAKGGEGPGEMGNYFMFSNTGNDTLLVNQIVSSQRDYFVPDPAGAYRFLRSDKPTKRPERSFTIIGAQSDTSYYATAGGFFSFNTSDKSDYKSSELVVVNSSGQILQDSVQMFKTANPHVVRNDNNISARDIPLRFDDDLAILPNGSYLIARIDSNAIYKYSTDHTLEKKIPLNIAARSVTAIDLDNVFGETDPKARNELEAKIRDEKPPFQDMWANEQYILLYTERTENGREMVAIDYDGNALGKFTLPDGSTIRDFDRDKIYAIDRSPTKGDLIRVYQVSFNQN